MKQTDGNKAFWKQILDFLEAAIRANRGHDDIVGKISFAAQPEHRHSIHPRDSAMLPLSKEHDTRWKKMREFLQDYRVREDWGWIAVQAHLLLIANGMRDVDRYGPSVLLPLYD